MQKRVRVTAPVHRTPGQRWGRVWKKAQERAGDQAKGAAVRYTIQDNPETVFSSPDPVQITTSSVVSIEPKKPWISAAFSGVWKAAGETVAAIACSIRTMARRTMLAAIAASALALVVAACNRDSLNAGPGSDLLPGQDFSFSYDLRRAADLQSMPDLKQSWDPAWACCHDVQVVRANPNATLPPKAVIDVRFDASTWNANELAMLRATDPNLNSIRFLAGTCMNPDVNAGYLRHAIQAAALSGTSIVWVELPNAPDVSTLAMLTCNPVAGDVSDRNLLPLLTTTPSGAGGEILDGGTLPTPNVCTVMQFGNGHRLVAEITVSGQNNFDSNDAYWGFGYAASLSGRHAFWVYDGPNAKYADQKWMEPATRSAMTVTDNALHVSEVARTANDVRYRYDGSTIHVMADNVPAGPLEICFSAKIGVKVIAKTHAVAPYYDAEPAATVSP